MLLRLFHSMLTARAAPPLAMVVLVSVLSVPTDRQIAAGGPVFTVSTTVDASDAAPGNGMCDTGDGECSLRAAIEESNASGGPARIILPPGTYPVSTGGVLIIASEVDITGRGAGASVIDGGDQAGVLKIAPEAVVGIAGVTIRRGAAQQGAGVFNAGRLILSRSVIEDNMSLSSGGGLFNDEGARAELVEVVIRGNVAQRSESGGGIFNAGTITVRLSEVGANTAISGAGIHNAGSMDIEDSLIGGNAGTAGGGIRNDPGGSLAMRNSSISTNAANYGGGVLNEGTAEIAISSITGNSAEIGGGILSAGDLQLRDVAFSDNTGGDCETVREGPCGQQSDQPPVPAADDDSTSGPDRAETAPPATSNADNGGRLSPAFVLTVPSDPSPAVARPMPVLMELDPPPGRGRTPWSRVGSDAADR